MIFIPRRIKPDVQSLKINNKDIEIIKVKISKSEYIECESSSHNMWANGKKGTWGSGLINNKDDPRKAERTGRLGEMALCKLLGKSIDLTYRIGGDKGIDILVLNNKKLDLKTSFKRYSKPVGLVVAVNEYGKKSKLKSDLYGIAFLEKDDREKQQAIVVLVGYQTKEFVLQSPIVNPPNPCWTHKNYEIPYETLIPFSTLLNE